LATARSVRDDVKQVLDYLIEAELAIYANEVSLVGASRVTWHAHDPAAPFLVRHDHATLKQYLHWVVVGAYSAILFDGSLLQITYDIESGQVSGHRLAFIPCPFVLDNDLLRDGEPLADIIEMYRDVHIQDMVLRSSIRFDHDPAGAKAGHPSAHMTVNSPDCRIACVAPMHVLRFVDFVFRNFYPALHSAHRDFFANAVTRHLGGQLLTDADRTNPHLTWQQDTLATG
jgi:hypothetical protein